MNTNSNIKRILCYGDSNTWGYIPGSDHERYPSNVRWTGVLQSMLGEAFEIIEEGLNSRTLNSDDPRPGYEGKNGFTYLVPCLNTHNPIDLIVLFLGTNDLKFNLGFELSDIENNIEKYIKTIKSVSKNSQNKSTKVLLIVPPIVREDVDYSKEKYAGANIKSMGLPNLYGKIAQKNDCLFLDLQAIMALSPIPPQTS